MDGRTERWGVSIFFGLVNKFNSNLWLYLFNLICYGQTVCYFAGFVIKWTDKILLMMVMMIVLVNTVVFISTLIGMVFSI